MILSAPGGVPWPGYTAPPAHPHLWLTLLLVVIILTGAGVAWYEQRDD